MKKIIPILVLLALAVPVGLYAETVEIEPPLNDKTFKDIIDSVINFIFYLGLAVTPLMIVIAGFMILTARDDAERLKKGRLIIIYTLVGLFVILFAKGLISVLNQAMGVKNG